MDTSIHIRIRSPRTPGRAAVPALALILVALGCGQYGGGDAPTGAAGAATATAVTPPDPAVAIGSFQTLLYEPILTQYCGPTCHVGGGAEGTPLISHADVPTAYSATVDTQKVNFGNPSSSRLVRRLAADFHNCWSNCMADAMTMEMAIIAWADAIAAASGGGGTTVTGGLFSNELTLADGQEDLTNRRFMSHLIALWEFKETGGTVAFDTSGVDPPLNLSLEGPQRMSNYGIDIQSGRAIANAAVSKKLYDRIADPGPGTQQYTLEAWVIPDNTDQEGPARIVSYSRDTGRRNVTMGQVLYQYNFRNRSLNPEISDNGTPALQTYDMDEDLQATLQHVVMTYDQFRGRRIFVNGRWTDDLDENAPGLLWNWEPGARMVLGNEVSGGDRQWVGKIQLVAVYDHALTDVQIRQNYDAGVGKRLLLAFDVSAWLGPGSLIEFQVREFDQYSYLFCQPTIVMAGPAGFRLSNMRIMVNGSIPVQGQAFVRLDQIVASSRQELSPTCSIIPKDLGAGSDAFALAFEVLGGFDDPVIVDPLPPGGPPVFGAVLPGMGIRDFARINEMMAEMTTVPASNAAVEATFQGLTQALPSGFDLRAFSSSHQVGIAKLALEYCDQAIESPTIRVQLAPNFDFDSDVATALDAAGQATLIQELTVSLLGQDLVTPLASQPTVGEVMPVLQTMISDLTTGCTPATCGVDRTRTIAKATCSALIGSAAGTIH